MKTEQTSGRKWYAKRGGAALASVLSLAAAYLVGSRAISTGSLQQYTLTLVLLILTVNRAWIIIKPRHKHRGTV